MGTRTERDFGGGFGFGIVENSHKDVMVLPHYHHPSPSSSSLCYCSAGVGDPMFSASSNQPYTSPSSASLGEMFSLSGSGSGSNSVPVSVADPFFTLSSSGEMGRCTSDKSSVAFSEAQWQELERQKNIYKYMMASVPVPSELLSPFSKNSSNTNPDVAVGNGGSLKLGITSNASNNTADQEPWRCKRTDGKKWRCSRNVIPDQKYCERHTHKSRPRSRKHVESSHHNDHITRTTAAKNDNTISQFATTYPQYFAQPESHFSLLPPSASPSYDHHHRGLRWFMKEDNATTTLNPELQVGSSRELKRGFEYDLNFGQKEPLVNQSFGALQGLLHTPHGQEQDEAMGSSLTLSMAGGYMEEGGTNHQQHQWVSHEDPSPTSWLCSTTTPGGPLAEALCLGVSNNASTSTTHSSCSRGST